MVTERFTAAEGMLTMSSTMESRGAQVNGGHTHHKTTKAALNKPGLLPPAMRGEPAAASGSAVTSGPAVNATRVKYPVWQVEPARPGDHHLACHLLASVQRAPSLTEFQAQLDDPVYEPTDRLLCRANDLLVGHLRLVKRELRFGAATLPVSNLVDLLVLPEFRTLGCGSALVSAAERAMAADGALLGLVRTRQPHFFLRRGWCVWSRYSSSTAGAREILSQLLESRPEHAGEMQPSAELNIRLWRHIELTGMIRLYNGSTQCSFGPLVRTDAYWHWLLSRRAFDRIYVAIRGPDRFELDEGANAMVGYAVMKEGRILELMAPPDCPQAAEGLLARACSDTIEQDGNYVRLEAPAADRLHRVFSRAGGESCHHESQHGEFCLVKLLDTERAVELLQDELRERAKSAGLGLPLELGLHVDGEKLCLAVRPRGVKLRTGRLCRSYLECGRGEWTQLLLGHLDLQTAVAAGHVVPSTRVALETAAILFPKLPLWRPPWDELPAR
jgi:GNAT superfamily N-acetyltransferase